MKRTFRVTALIQCTSEDDIEQIEEEYANRAAIAQLLRNRGNEFAIQEPRDAEGDNGSNGRCWS